MRTTSYPKHPHVHVRVCVCVCCYWNHLETCGVSYILAAAAAAAAVRDYTTP